MFCYQCEQTAKGQGCTSKAVCGKSEETAGLQDLLIYAVKGLAQFAVAGAAVGVEDDAVDQFACEAVFATLTNVDFDEQRFVTLINDCVALRDGLKGKVVAAGGEVNVNGGPADFRFAADLNGMLAQAAAVGVNANTDLDPDIHSLQQLLTYGVKGLAAYADHARILGQTDKAVFQFVHQALAATLDESLGVNDLVGLVLKCGEVNLRAMELLYMGNSGTFGKPVPTQVSLGTKAGKAILVSGHDLKDIDDILKQSEGKGIYVYTHGEMLPCHGYPELKKYPHFFGHYGTAWQNQRKEFAAFPGAILMTTNCIQEPADNYKGNIFTTGLVGWPDVTHIADKNFAPVIEKALEMPGFTEDRNGKSVHVGFGHDAILGLAETVVGAVKSGALRHFFLVGGCDGAKPGRNYYTEFVDQVPDDCVVLTLACGKFRFFDKEMGDIGGIPRLLDVGQCNDAYSAIKVAVALAEAFECGVNDLPLSMVLSWYEQKAVVILLTLLHLGIKNIRLGPSLPAFISPNVLNVLVENFNIMPIKTPAEDLKAILG
ncbi:hydroxylamine reductase [bacterium]|nr:hydroxylamine reductase [bacterium]